jgi:hypothetical protein
VCLLDSLNERRSNGILDFTIPHHIACCDEKLIFNINVMLGVLDQITIRVQN